MAARSAISLQGVTQVFAASDGSETTALADISFTVAQHEFLAVLGPSGCGKSTILRIIAGLVKPTRGVAAINEAAISGPRDEIGIVFQRPTLLPWLNVLDNVTFPMRHKYGRVTAKDKERGHEMLALVGLQDSARKRPEELSGGMQQRVGIARALLHDPDILLMDEPFSALDALTRDEMSLELLRIWAERPKTVLFITHSIPEAVLLADRILLLSPRPGRVQEVLPVELPRPRSMVTLEDPRFSALANHIRARLITRPAAA
jgi:NitT/TauT family transport system ATP-binding protein